MKIAAKKKLIEKYDVVGPRYTSYPPVPYWEKTPSPSEWLFHLQKIFDEQRPEVDLYLHIPFCKNLCHYCGCNRVLLQDEQEILSYLCALRQEWSLYIKKFDNMAINGIHFGGGTPTVLSAKSIDFVLSGLFENASRSKNFKGSFEADPRTTTSEQLSTLYSNWGFRRLSFGVQDFSPSVQKIIGRNQSFEVVAQKVELSRQIGFNDINFDLIFGLPGQSEQSIKHTFELVAKLHPSTIAFYGYAHVPSFAKDQTLLEKYSIPVGHEKRKLYETGRELLDKLGYIEIGMDHFALPQSFLYKAFKKGTLCRNFMGYTIHKAPVLLGLGASSISSSYYSFIQNEREVESYLKKIKHDDLAILRGHICTEKDFHTRQIIHDIMCCKEVSVSNFPNVDLDDFIKDQLLAVDKDKKLTVLDRGRPFVRNICMAFDYRLNAKKGSKKAFSRTI